MGMLMRRHESYLTAVELQTVNSQLQSTTDIATEIAENEAVVDLTDTTPVTGENAE